MALAAPLPAGVVRRFLTRAALVRRPVSVTRRRIGLLLLATILLGAGLYSFTTRDEAIRRRVESFLEEATGGQVSVGRARFRMFGGITLHDVRVGVSFDRRLDPQAIRPDQREIFSATSVLAVHNPWRLLLGDLRIEWIVATQPTITLVHNVDTGVRNWQLLARQPLRAPRRKKPRHRPQITLRRARAVVVSVRADASRESRTEELDADVQPHPQSETGFRIEIRRFTEPADRTTVIFDPGARLVTNTPFVDARTVRLQLPKAAQQFFRLIALEGEVKISRLIYDASAPGASDTEIRLRRVRCRIPLSMLHSNAASREAGTAAVAESEGAAVTMTDVEGRLDFNEGRLNLEISGRVNGARCVVGGSLIGVDQPLERIGIDARLAATALPAPEGALREQLIEDPSVPCAIRSILGDFDPHGAFDVDLTLSRRAGGQAPLTVRGALRPRGAVGRHRWFPYALTDLTGDVRFDGPHVTIDNLVGHHADAAVVFDGRLDRSKKWSEIAVVIRGTGVPLDADLYRALSGSHQDLWRRFDPRGRADIRVELQRPGATEQDPPPAWTTRVAAELRDAQAQFSDYPYPLENVRGRVEIDADRIRFVGVSGRHGPALVCVDGYAATGEGGGGVDLRIEARDVPLDEALGGALPRGARDVFAQFQPRGTIDLLGTVATRASDGAVDCEIRAVLRDAAVRYRHFPFRVGSLHGDVLIRPDELEIRGVRGVHDDAAIAVDGRIRTAGSGCVADLNIKAEHLATDAELHEALPPGLKAIWRMLQPAGRIGVETALHAEVDESRRWYRHRTRLHTRDARIRFEGFPLPLERVVADVIADDRCVRIDRLTGQAGGGAIEVSGVIELGAGGSAAPCGTLRIAARNMRFEPAVIEAMPKEIRGALASIRPAGRFDLLLDPLRFDADEQHRRRWTLAGRLCLVDAAGDLGFSLQGVTGVVRGCGTVSADGRLALGAAIELDTATLANWEFSRLTGRLRKDANAPLLRVADMTGEAYGGSVSAFGEVRVAAQCADYHASITARDLQLAQFIRVAQQSDRPPASSGLAVAVRAAGKPHGEIHGNMILQGRSGPGGYREAAGELFVREAQVWRLPLIFAIFQVLYLTPDENVFHDGWLKYYLTRDVLSFENIELQGKVVSFSGRGRMTLSDRQLDITLLTGSPVRVRVPILTELWESAAREMMEVHITGTLERPNILPKPLRSLARVVRSLVTPPPRRAP